jgi:DNA-binding CsgD family transcriptional regulator
VAVVIRPTLPPGLLETLQGLAEGLTTEEIAARVFVSVEAVRARLPVLYRHLGANNRAHAVAIAYQMRVLDPGPPLVLPCTLAAGVPLGALVLARERSGISQQAMADRLKFSRPWLGLRESGRQPFPLLVVRQYARIVRFDLDGEPVPLDGAA